MSLDLHTYKTFLLVNPTTTDTNLLWNLTYIFLGLSVLYFVSILFFKKKLSNSAINTSKKRSELAPIISNFLFHSSEDSTDEQKEYVNLKIEIREYLRNSAFRKILSEILFDLQKDVSGTTEERLFKLYKELGLDQDSFAKLKSWRWEVVSQGILELTQMQVKESYQLIIKFINDKRGTIRKQAEIATIKLRNEGIEYILDSTSYTISEWQQLKMIEALGGLKDYTPPRFKSWLISENKDVVLFALRLIKHYNQNDAAASIIELVKHKNDQIKLAAIQCIKDFNFTEAKSILRSIFLECNDDVKIQILGTIAVFGDESDIPFLNGVALKENNFLVSSKARSAINSISPDSMLPTKDITTVNTSSDLEMELPIEELKPSIIHSDENTTVSISEDFIEIETTDETDIFEIDEEAPEQIEVAGIKNKEIVAPEAELNQENFEFGEMDSETDDNLNDELGLLSSENDNILFKNPNEEEIQNEYVSMSFEEKDTYIDTIDDFIDSKQIVLLEMIMEHEDESELRFKAFKKLQLLKTQFPVKALIHAEKQEVGEDEQVALFDNKKEETIEELEDTPITKEIESVFYPLYQKASDLDSRLILIQQMGLLGDEKELVFLNTLLDATESKITKSTKKAITALESRIVKPSIDSELTDSDVAGNNDELILDEEPITLVEEEVIIIPNAEEKIEENNKLPLELCFLEDEFGISASKTKKDDDFDFELSEEFFLNLKSNESHEH